MKFQRNSEHWVITQKTLPIGPSISSSGGWSMMCRNIGRRKAKVFPLPVLAIPIKSRPEKYKVMIIKNRKDKNKWKTIFQCAAEKS